MILEQDYQQFIQNIKVKTGIDLSLYKENQMKRRLASLRDKKGYSNFNDFFRAMQNDDQLLDKFLDRMTINVSEFFRNSGRWKILEEKIIPNLPDKKRIKCWSAACSTGEEPYTLSMIFNSRFPNIKAEITATDIDEIALKKAKEGVYAERALKEVPDKILNKFFNLQGNMYHVLPNIKKDIKFQRLDLLVDKFEKNYDLIICRNVMIYFTEDAKNLLYQKFSDALKPGGVLFVGSTEQIFNPGQYQLVAVDNFFYQKK